MRRIYSRVPAFGAGSIGDAGNEWGISVSTRIWHMAEDSEWFRTSAELESEGFVRHDNEWVHPSASGPYAPLYEAKMISAYDHRFGSYSTRYYFVPRNEIDKRLRGITTHEWLIAFKDVTTAITERTCVFAFLPRVAVGHSAPLLFVEQETPLILTLIGTLNSLVFDYCTRNKVAGLHLTVNILEQLPVPRPAAFTSTDVEFIATRVLELTYTSRSLAPLATEAGFNGGPFRWDPDRRALLKTELDAYFAYLYGLSRDELRYILDPQDVMGSDYPSETFRVLKENECKLFGEYRTRRLVLEAWDRFAEDGTFDPARLQDPTHFDVVRRALVETRGRVGALERERDELAALLKRSDATPLPTLFVEGESDVAILTAAWRTFYPTEELPVTILAAGGTRQMESLAGRGVALRQLLGDRLVFALADNDREGRALVEDGRTRRGGQWRQQSNGIHWCLLAATAEFVQAMKRFGIPDTFWPFTIENAFPAALRRQAMAAGAYAVDEVTVQPAFLEDAATSNKALRAAHQLEQTGDHAALYFRPPAPETKLAFAAWITAPERRDRTTFAVFAPILDGLRALADKADNPVDAREREAPSK
jgi:hypothetical protein